MTRKTTSSTRLLLISKITLRDCPRNITKVTDAIVFFTFAINVCLPRSNDQKL